MKSFKAQGLELIPSINVLTFVEVKERIVKVEPYVSWCHLDVTDGVFSKHETWRDPKDLARLQTKLNVEVHLMVAEPENVIEQWLVVPVKRVIVHIEAMKNPELIIKKCREADVEVGFAINPETPWEKLQPWFGPVKSPMPKASADALGRLTSNEVNKVDMVQVLAVKPGPSGQKMNEDTYAKIGYIRTACPRCIIEVDGGVNSETARKAVEAGANLLVAGHAIFGSKDVKKAIEELKLD